MYTGFAITLILAISYVLMSQIHLFNFWALGVKYQIFIDTCLHVPKVLKLSYMKEIPNLYFNWRHLFSKFDNLRWSIRKPAFNPWLCSHVVLPPYRRPLFPLYVEQADQVTLKSFLATVTLLTACRLYPLIEVSADCLNGAWLHT